MLQTRVIPCLLLQEGSLIKTTTFRKGLYIGDPVNTVRIFNELEVDELLLLDVTASYAKKGPDLKTISKVASQCFMPLGYGGGINSLDHARAVFKLGVEKIVINTSALENPIFISDLVKYFGSQAIVVSIDVKKNIFGNYIVKSVGGRRSTRWAPLDWAIEVEKYGAGEILLTAIDREGSWQGFDVNLVKSITSSVNIPVIAHGGAGCLNDISEVVYHANASAVALGSLVVYQKKGMGVLVNFPSQGELKVLFGDT